MDDRGIGMQAMPPAEVQAANLVSRWSARRVVLATLTVLAVLAVFWLLLRFYVVIFILFVGIVLSIAIRPATDLLHRWRLSLPVAVITVYIVLALIVAGFLLLVAPPLVEQVTTIIGNIPKNYQTLRSGLLSSDLLLIRSFAYQIPPQLALQLTQPTEGAPLPAIDPGMFVSDAGRAAFVVISVLTLAFYWTLNGERTVRALLLRAPQESREHLREIIGQMEAKVGAFLRGQAILCLSVACAMLVALIIIQLPYALSLALLAGMFEAIPILGPTLGAVPALLVAVAVAPDKVIWVIVAVIIIQQLESNVLIPRIMDKSVGVNPIVSILSIIAFGTVFGLPGALLAIPLAAIIQVLISYTVFEPPAPLPTEEGRGKASVLRYEVQQLRQDVRKHVRVKDKTSDSDTDRVEDLIESIATDVDSLLADREKANVVEAES